MAIASSTITTDLLDTTVTSNTNLLQPNAFKVQINRKKFPNIEFFAVGVIHPGLGMNATEVPFRRIQSVPMAGAALTFGEVTIDTILDENMTAYTEVFNWMHYIVNNDDVLPQTILPARSKHLEKLLKLRCVRRSMALTHSLSWRDGCHCAAHGCYRCCRCCCSDCSVMVSNSARGALKG